MRILITSNTHRHYDKTGEIIAKNEDGTYIVRIPHKDGGIQTTVREGEYKETKVQ